MDRGDKSLNKAATAAYKYFLFQAFTIPVEGTPDADSETHEIDAAPITASQVKEVNDLLAATNSDSAAFCKLMKVDSVESLTAEQFPVALRKLNEKQARMIAE
jgi:hypothetical protein